MGISVRQMLNSDFFKSFKVLAGHGGLDRQVQGITVLDSPDGYLWTKGREFVISSGYIFLHNEGLLEEYCQTEYMKNSACLGIKLNRYLNEIPPSVLKLFDEHEVPLILIPNQYSWMEIVNGINVLAMNKSFNSFNIGELKSNRLLDTSYHDRKINKILSSVESEMKFPAMLYDITNGKVYYSSHRFNTVCGFLKTEDFWNPSFNFSKEILCDSLDMARFRFFDDSFDKPFSWITVPISVDNKLKAYFVVIESTDLIDFFDQFSIRIGFLTIQGLYEQIIVAQSIADTVFEKYARDVLSGRYSSKEEITTAANSIGLNMTAKSYSVVMNQFNNNILLSAFHEKVKGCLRLSFDPKTSRMIQVGDNTCLFLFRSNDELTESQNIDTINDKLTNLKKRLELEIDGVALEFGVSDIPEYVFDLKDNYERANQALNIGRRLFPNKNIRLYSNLGPFAWINIKDNEVSAMLKDLEVLYSNPNNRELLTTLKVYLECKMNYSNTAKQMFLHINTVRKRIEDIHDLIKIDLEDPITRLKVEMIVKLFC